MHARGEQRDGVLLDGKQGKQREMAARAQAVPVCAQEAGEQCKCSRHGGERHSWEALGAAGRGGVQEARDESQLFFSFLLFHVEST